MTSPLRAPAPTPQARTSPPRPYLRVAPEPYRRRRTAAMVSLAVVVIFGSLLASAVFHSVLVRGQLHLDDVQRRTEQTRLEVARDQLRLAELRSPPYLAAEARRMGMVPATQVYAVASGPEAPVATSTEATTQQHDDQTDRDDAEEADATNAKKDATDADDDAPTTTSTPASAKAGGGVSADGTRGSVR